MSHFDDLFWLVEVVDAGTLSAAAERHGVSSAAVSKRLSLMEARLGVKLLVRNSRHLHATEAGELYYRRGKLLLDEFRELEDRVSSTSERLSGRIRINAPLSFGLRRLVGPVNAFMQQHPEVQVALHLDDSFIDIANSDYDLVMRIGKLRDSSTVAQRVSTIGMVCCASPAYLEKHGTPSHPLALEKHNCLVYEQGSRLDQWTFRKGADTVTVTATGSLQANNGDLIAESACAGLGVAYLPDFACEHMLASGRLQPLLTEYTLASSNVYAMYPSRHFQPQKVKRLIALLSSSLPHNAGI